MESPLLEGVSPEAGEAGALLPGDLERPGDSGLRFLQYACSCKYRGVYSARVTLLKAWEYKKNEF